MSTKTHSTPSARSSKPVKPDKPYPEFPLFPHATRRWAKKIRGKMHYFGAWDDPNGALQKYLDQKDDLHAGRTPKPNNGELTVRDLCNRFMTSKKLLLDSGEITQRTWADYYASCERIMDSFDKNRLVSDVAADDFERFRASLSERWGPVAVGNEIQRVRVLFKYGYDAGLLEKPMRYGPGFKRPSKKVLRKARAEKGPKMFESAALRKILKAAGQPLRAMILLGINCGFGNADCGTLPEKALDLKNGWIDFPRPKTGILRRCKLWSQTIKAVREAIKLRPDPKAAEDADLVFVTKQGHSWAKNSMDNPVSKEMRKLLDELDLHRPGLNFYALRHTFETIAGDAKDQVAVDHVMGHARDDMASLYRERIDDARLAAVAEHVRKWLFAAKKKGK